MKKEVAECIGLWLAEGDNKSKGEITFTNNCWDLVEYFHNTLSNLFSIKENKIRIYIYTPNGEEVTIPIKNVRIKRYVHRRATKPYFIWRMASVEMVKDWKNLINSLEKEGIIYSGILRGFFAGEGNIKSSSHNCRMIRMSQSKRIKIIEDALDFYNIKYSFSERHHRDGYVISKKENWDKLAKIKIADLHPEKRNKFWRILNEYKQVHYSKGYLKKEIYKILKLKAYNVKQLSKIFDRSQDRISEVLINIKKEGKIRNFRIKSTDYWIANSSNKILISKIKKKYLNALEKGLKRTNDLSKKFEVCHKSSFKRLNELEKLNLIKRNEDKTWKKIRTKKQIVVI